MAISTKSKVCKPKLSPLRLISSETFSKALKLLPLEMRSSIIGRQVPKPLPVKATTLKTAHSIPESESVSSSAQQVFSINSNCDVSANTDVSVQDGIDDSDDNFGKLHYDSDSNAGSNSDED